MPRLYHRPPKYCLHKGTKQATVSINGHRIYLGPYGSPQSHIEYQKVLQRWHESRDHPTEPAQSPPERAATVTAASLRKKRLAGSPITLNELALVFRRHAHQYYRKNGKITREATLIDDMIRFLRKYHATTFLDEFGPVLLDELRSKMIPELDWSRKHINKQVSRLQRFTGARPGEICSLRPGDLDQSTDIWVYTPSEHKTEHHDKERIIAIGPRAQEILTPYLSRKPDAFCFSPAESERMRRNKLSAARITPASYGNRRGTNRKTTPKRRPRGRYFTDSYRRAIHRACDKLKIEKWAPNRLRHTSATQIRKEFGIEAAQVICGHESADVTQVYAERDLELAKKVAREVG